MFGVWYYLRLFREHFLQIKNVLIFFSLVSALPQIALLSIQASSPERRFTQKEIIAGEERPKYLLIKQHADSVAPGSNATPTGIYDFINIFSNDSFFSPSFSIYCFVDSEQTTWKYVWGIHTFWLDDERWMLRFTIINQLQREKFSDTLKFVIGWIKIHWLATIISIYS